MTYVSDKTSEELGAHMRMLQAMAGWHDPLSDRLWAEVQKLKAEVQRITEARRVEWSNAQQVQAELDALKAAQANSGIPGRSFDPAIESEAKRIYQLWSDQPGYMPWVEGGNSDQQQKARERARRKQAVVERRQ